MQYFSPSLGTLSKDSTFMPGDSTAWDYFWESFFLFLIFLATYSLLEINHFQLAVLQRIEGRSQSLFFCGHLLWEEVLHFQLLPNQRNSGVVCQLWMCTKVYAQLVTLWHWVLVLLSWQWASWHPGLGWRQMPSVKQVWLCITSVSSYYFDIQTEMGGRGKLLLRPNWTFYPDS